jgi:hypothetical protein
MWRLVKAEIKYNADFIYPLAWGVCFFFINQYYYAYVALTDIDISSMLVLQGGLFLPLVAAIRRGREKRDRMQVLLPLSIRRISAARVMVFVFYLLVVLVSAIVLNYLSLRLFPNIISPYNAYLCLAAVTLIYSVVFHIIVPDLKGCAPPGGRFLFIPVRKMFYLSRLVLGIAAGLFYLPLMAAIQNFSGTRGGEIPFGFAGKLTTRMLHSGTWTAGLALLALALALTGVWLFEVRRSYTGK